MSMSLAEACVDLKVGNHEWFIIAGLKQLKDRGLKKGLRQSVCQ